MVKKKDKEEPTTSSASMSLAMKAVEKKFGAGVLKWLEDVPVDGYEFISTGSMGLDYALGGGLVRGRVVEIYGPPGSGKSTLAMATVVDANQKGMKALYIDAERALDPKLPRQYGVDPSMFLLEDAPVSVEDHFEILETTISSREFGVCVVDSVTALITTAEMEAATDKEFMGKIPKFLSEKLRRLIQLLGETNTLLIFINQLRNKIGVNGNPETTPGGEAIKFYATHRIRTEGGTYKSTRILNPENGEVVGHKMKYEVVKNKIAAPFRTGEIDLIYGKGYDVAGELVDIGSSLGVIEQSGAWFKTGGRSFQGRDSMKEALLTDPEVYTSVRNAVHQILFGK